MGTLLWPRVVVTVPPGSIGVLWRRFSGGTVLDTYLHEGVQFILPWNSVYMYDARLRRLDLTATSPSIDGLPVTVQTTVTFDIVPQSAGLLQTRLGPDYVATVLTPLAGGTLRETIGRASAVQLYSANSQTIETEMEGRLRDRIDTILGPEQGGHPLIRIAHVSLRSIELPPVVKRAIEDKVAANEAIESASHGVEQARQEARRREVEAEGIRRFQEIVAPAISDNFLRWRGIEATLELAQSPNAKVVVIGGGAGGLPLILDTRSDAVAAPASPETALPAGDSPAKPPAGTGRGPLFNFPPPAQFYPRSFTIPAPGSAGGRQGGLPPDPGTSQTPAGSQ